MKQFSVFLFVLFFLAHTTIAQEITYAEFNSEDNKDMNFDILGKMNDGYVIYKNLKSKHLLAVYDDQMRIKNTINLSFVPSKTFNIDFITYPDHFYMVYQYEKNRVVYCMGVKIKSDGTKLNEPVQLDTTRITVYDVNKIYNTIYSQDKKKILVYKMHLKREKLTIATKLFNTDMQMLDSTRVVTDFDSRREIYSDLLVDNDGNIVFSRGTKGVFRDNIDMLDIICRKPGDRDYKTIAVNLKDNFIEDVKIKIDNLNKHYIFNTFYYTQQRGNVKGLFTLVMDAVAMDTLKSVFNVLPDSIRPAINSDGQFRTAFNDLEIQQVIAKKDGGFILATEDCSFQSITNPNDTWNRMNYPYTSYNGISSDYYYSNPGYGYYRPRSSFSSRQMIRYYNENILILSFDSNLNILWNNIILKSQSDDDNDNFLSFSTMNVGGEIRFLYNEGNRNSQIISNQGISPDGQLKRYPTLKSRQAGYEFMPRLARQIGYREIIVPCVYRNNIAFAKVVFPE